MWPAVAAPAFDLQSHSVHSDGELPAAQVVENAAAAGVELLALSDHDTVDGVDEALAAGAVHGVRVVRRTPVGNLYVNRPITGAMVGRQPFGGNRLSGTGTKAGGPDYLLHFVEPHVVSENTVRHGLVI